MLSVDTNILVHASNTRSPLHRQAADFLQSLALRTDVVICELMLVEVYLKICNAKILESPFPPAEAASYCQAFRTNQNWLLVEFAPVMSQVWVHAAGKNRAFRRIIDTRLALTLRHHGVTEFATTNLKDFQGLGFARVWNPLVEG